MKKILIPFLVLLLPAVFSCSSLQKFGGYTLNEKDAAQAVRQLLEIGVRDGVLRSGAFSKETIMSTLFPEPMKKALNTLKQLGLTNEVDRFTTTLSTAAEKTAVKSSPIFLNAIRNMKFTDAMRIVKNGGTSATDYLRSTAGDSIRRAITPVMQAALDEYKLTEQWNEITKPAKAFGSKINLDLANLMAGLVSEAMFQKIEDEEIRIRREASARKTQLLQKVFSKNWN